MTRGKKVCKILKEIRQQIAEKNDIEYITSECHFQGECKGTCPKCEAEVRYLENELNKWRQLGKAATIAGISLGIVSSFACNTLQANTPVSEKISMEKIKQDSIMNLIPVMFIEEVEKEFDDDDTIEGIMVEPVPEYPGGDKARAIFLRENLIYPKEAKEGGIEGIVYVQFVIEKDGSIVDVEVLKGIGGGCDEEAVRVIKMMPKWKPGKQGGKEVRTRFTIPLKFSLKHTLKNETL